MTGGPTQVLVLADAEGEYYLLLPEVLEGARVAAARRAVIERLLAGDVVGMGGALSGQAVAPEFRCVGVLRLGQGERGGGC
jgi:hypothetical protein